MMKKKLMTALLGVALFALTLGACGGKTSNSTKDSSSDSSTVITKKYTVAFEVDGVRYKTLKVEEGTTINETIQDPEKDGYSFVGWTLNNELVDLSNYVVTMDVTFVAKFKEASNELSVDDIKEEGKTYSLVLGWWEVVPPEKEPNKKTSYLTKTIVRMFYKNLINVLKAKGQTDEQIDAISFRNYSTELVADMGAMVNKDNDVGLLIGVGANVFTQGNVLPYEDDKDSAKFSTEMGVKVADDGTTSYVSRYVALVKSANDLAVDIFKWLQSDIGKQSFLRELTADEISKSLQPVTINLTVTVHGDTDEITELKDEETIIKMPSITIPEGKKFIGFASSEGGEVVLDKKIDAVLKYSDVKSLVEEGQDTLDLYPVFEELPKEDLVVYVQGNYISEAEAKLLESRFKESLTQDQTIKFNYKNTDAAGFKQYVGSDADVIIGGNNPLNSFTLSEGITLANAGSYHFANSSRKIIVPSSVTLSHLDLAKSLYDFVVADAPLYSFHTTFWVNAGKWVSETEVTNIKSGIETRVNTYLGINDGETLLSKYNVKIEFEQPTETKVADLGAVTNAYRDGKGTDLIVGCGENVYTSGKVNIIEKKLINNSSLVAKEDRQVALVLDNCLARDIYENYFVTKTVE